MKCRIIQEGNLYKVQWRLLPLIWITAKYDTGGRDGWDIVFADHTFSHETFAENFINHKLRPKPKRKVIKYLNI
jgi:hypothetical protein